MSERPVLFIREGELAGQSITIDNDDFVMGRGSDCSLTLPERMVSRHHARIYQQGGRYYLQDLGSKNGTHVNGYPLTGSIVLTDGDELQVALAVKLIFIGTDATVPLSFEEPQPQTRLVLDEDKRTVIVSGTELDPPLSLAQFRLIKVLFDAEGAVVDRDAIVEAVWPGTEGLGVSEQAIDALVRRLRDRLAEIDDENYIVTVRGHGFRLDNAPA
jgi:hypothetical protein